MKALKLAEICTCTIKTSLSFILFGIFTSGDVFGCTIGNCNACTTLKSKCACIAMTFFQYKPVRHHNYKDMDDYEYVHLINCDPDKPSVPNGSVPGISLSYKGVNANTQNKYYDCNFKYVRFRDCHPGNNGCEKNDDIIEVHLDIEENNNTVDFYYNESAKNAGNNCPASKKDGKKWDAFWLKVGPDTMCFDACTTGINSGYPGENETYPMGVVNGGNAKLWCMVYGDLRNSGINDKYLRRFDDGGTYKNAGANKGASGYCGNDILKKYMDDVSAVSVPYMGSTLSVQSIANLKGGIPILPSSSEQTTSESTNSTCPAGQVFSGGKCISCTAEAGWVNYAKENRKFCPEGNKQGGGLSVYQQFKKCPKGMWPNATLTDCDCGFNLNKNTSNDGCVGNLSKDDMYYGPLGKSAPLFKQCWTKVSEKAYKKCMGFDDKCFILSKQ